MDSYRVPNRFFPKQSGHFSNDVFEVDDPALRRRAFFVERPQMIDHIGRAVSVLLNSSCRRARPFEVRWVAREPSQTRVGAGDCSGYRLPDFVGQRGGEFPHHIDAIDVSKIGLQLPQLFALFVGALSFGYIHGDTDILTDFLRRIVMSYAAQESDSAVGAANPKLDVVIH